MDKTTTPAPFIEETAVELDEMATLDKLAAGDPVTAAFFETDTTAVTALTRLFLEVTGIPVEKVDEFSVFHIEAGNGAITATAALGTLRMTVALKENEIAALRTPALAGRKLAERLAEAANPIIRAMHGLETSPVVALDDAGTHQEPRATPQSTQDVEDDGFVTIYPAIREGLVEIRETTFPRPGSGRGHRPPRLPHPAAARARLRGRDAREGPPRSGAGQGRRTDQARQPHRQRGGREMNPSILHLVQALANVARASNASPFADFSSIIDEIESAILRESEDWDEFGESSKEDEPSEPLLNPHFDPEVWSRKIGEEALSALNVPDPTHGKGDPWPGSRRPTSSTASATPGAWRTSTSPSPSPCQRGPAQEIALVYPAVIGRKRLGERVPAKFSVEFDPALNDGTTITFNLTETVTLTAEEADPYAIELYEYGQKQVMVYLSTFGIGRTVNKGDTITLTPRLRPLPDHEEDGA
jgi:hypothetical protein